MNAKEKFELYQFSPSSGLRHEKHIILNPWSIQILYENFMSSINCVFVRHDYYLIFTDSHELWGKVYHVIKFSKIRVF